MPLVVSPEKVIEVHSQLQEVVFVTPTLLQDRRRAIRDTVHTVTRVASPRKADPRTLAIDAIVRETNCTRYEAEKTLEWINQFVTASRKHSYQSVYPSKIQMRTREYAIFDQIMPHGAASAPGSAHKAIETALLDPTRNEYTLLHDRRDEEHSPAFCTVQVCLCVI